MIPSRRLGVLSIGLAAVAAGTAGCAAATADAGAATGSGGGGGIACLTSACVPGVASHLTWAIEIDPVSNSPAALTELPSVDVGAEPLSLTADAQAPVGVTFSAAATGSAPATANVVLDLSPQIGGRPDLTFEAAAAPDASGDITSGSLLVPAGTLGRMGTLQLIPLSPADQQSPPASFAVTVAPSLAEVLATSYLSISGTLLSAIGKPPLATFVARAFAGGTQISSAPLTDSNGAFRLLLPPTAAGSSIVVELTPQDQSGPDPWYTSSPLTPTMNRNLDPIMLPAYSDPNVFNLAVAGADNGAAVSNAFVRARAILASSAAGATDYERDGTTSAATASGPAGTVTLSLLPGTATTALDYTLTVIPPASSPYATHCVSPVGVTVGGTASAPSSLLTVALTRRPVLTGSVTSAAGMPIGNVAITATAAAAATDSCTSTAAVSSSTMTDPSGQFDLPLDPGTYQLDYDPPAGSPVPRLTELAITIPAAGPGPAGGQMIAHDVTLPPAALVQGTVRAADGTPLPSATIRIFEPRCGSEDDCFGPARTPPWLRAQTASDATGAFRAVVPAPGSGG
jgi:hypothetical protein